MRLRQARNHSVLVVATGLAALVSTSLTAQTDAGSECPALPKVQLWGDIGHHSIQRYVDELRKRAVKRSLTEGREVSVNDVVVDSLSRALGR